MIDISTHPLELTARRFGNSVRIVAATFAVLALLALSFVLGRVTMGNAGHSSTIRPVVVIPANPAAGGSHTLPVCHLRGPC
jgi:hypothetical protein